MGNLMRYSGKTKTLISEVPSDLIKSIALAHSDAADNSASEVLNATVICFNDRHKTGKPQNSTTIPLVDGAPREL